MHQKIFNTLDGFINMYKEKSAIALGFSIATMFYDQVMEGSNTFPKLYIHGSSRTGKTKFAKMIKSFSSFVTVIDDNKNKLSKDNIIKIGRGITPVILIRKEPILDIQVTSNFFFIDMNGTSRKKKKDFDLLYMNHQAVNLDYVLNYRDKFNKNIFFSSFNYNVEKLSSLYDYLPKPCNLINNTAAIVAGYKILMKELDNETFSDTSFLNYIHSCMGKVIENHLKLIE